MKRIPVTVRTPYIFTVCFNGDIPTLNQKETDNLASLIDEVFTDSGELETTEIDIDDQITVNCVYKTPGTVEFISATRYEPEDYSINRPIFHPDTDRYLSDINRCLKKACYGCKRVPKAVSVSFIQETEIIEY